MCIDSQVIEAAERVSKLRREGPAQMYKHQRAALLASRPAAPLSEEGLRKDELEFAVPCKDAFKASSEALQEFMEASAADVPALRYAAPQTFLMLHNCQIPVSDLCQTYGSNLMSPWQQALCEDILVTPARRLCKLSLVLWRHVICSLLPTVHGRVRLEQRMTHVVCRAEVDDSMKRLARVLRAMNSNQKLVPPNTIERAFRPPDSPAASGVPSPQLANALSAGKISTRRRIANRLRPVPYPLH